MNDGDARRGGQANAAASSSTFQQNSTFSILWAALRASGHGIRNEFIVLVDY